jgi:hypothetical protein
MEQPFGPYLYATWVIMTITEICAFAAVQETCAAPIVMGILDIGLAAAHAAWALYLYDSAWNEKQAAHSKKIEVQAPQFKVEMIKKLARDPLFYSYLVTFVLALALNIAMLFFIHCSTTSLEWAAFTTAILMVAYSAGALIYVGFWVSEAYRLLDMNAWRQRIRKQIGPVAKVVGKARPVTISTQKGTNCVAKLQGPVYDKASLEAPKVRELEPGQQVIARGPVEEPEDGVAMVPIRPRGYVEARILYAASNEAPSSAGPAPKVGGAADVDADAPSGDQV